MELPIPLPRDQLSVVQLIYIDMHGCFVQIHRIPGADPDAFIQAAIEQAGAEEDDLMPCIWHLTAIYPVEGKVYDVITHSFHLGSSLMADPTEIRQHGVIRAPYVRTGKLRPLDSNHSPLYAVYDYMNFIGIRVTHDENGESDIEPMESPDQRYAVDDLLAGGDRLADEVEKFLQENSPLEGE